MGCEGGGRWRHSLRTKPTNRTTVALPTKLRNGAPAPFGGRYERRRGARRVLGLTIRRLPQRLAASGHEGRRASRRASKRTRVGGESKPPDPMRRALVQGLHARWQGGGFSRA